MKRKKKLNFLTLIALVIIFILGPTFLLRRIGKTKAAWFDDKFYYRTAITITNNGSATTNQKVKLDIDTATLYTAGKIQINCNDSRFTNANGKLLQYFLDSANGACNTNSTDYYVLMPTINAGTTTIYHYYGNPYASKGSVTSQFSQATFTQDATATNTEEQSKAPVVYWNFDEGYGTQTKDSTANGQNISFSGSPTWQTEDMCIAGKCLNFDTDNTDYAITSTLPSSSPLNLGTSNFTISHWQKVFQPTTFGSGIIGRYPHNTSYNGNFSTGIVDNTTTYFFYHRDMSGVFQSFTIDYSPYFGKWAYVSWVRSGSTMSLYIDGKFKKSWDITITFNISFSGAAFYISNTGWSPGTMSNLMIDDLKIYRYARSAAEIKSDYNARGTQKGAAVNVGAQHVAPAGISNGLVGYWKMDENTGTFIGDSSGIGSTGTFGVGSSAPTWSSGMYGVGLSFEGNDYVNLGDVSTFDFGLTTSYTLSAWIKTGVTQTENVMCKYNGNGIWEFKTNSSGQIALLVRGSDGNGLVTVNGATSVADNTWHHILAVRDYSTRKIYIYKDGILDGSGAESLTAGLGSTGTLAIGTRYANSNSITQLFNGSMDEVRVYNRALSPAEVQQLYNWAPGPVGYWNFDDVSIGSSVPDTSGYGNNGGWSGTGTTHWTTGKFGKAGKFNGTNDYVSTSLPPISPQNGFSVSFWLKPNINYQNDGASGKIRFLVSGGNDTTNSFWVRYYANWSNSLGMGYQYSGASPDYSPNEANTNLKAGTWYHISATFFDSTLKLYLNGVLFASRTNAVAPTSIAGTTMNIGRRISGDSYSDASIDDVRIYNYVRTQKQIVEDMNAGHPAGGSPVGSQVAWYDFNEGYGTTVNNRGNGGNSLNGTFGASTAAPTWTDNGKFGKALSFDGGDYVDNGANSDFAYQENDSWSVSLWMKTATDFSGSNSGKKLVAKATGGAIAGYAIAIGQINSSGYNNKIGFVIDKNGQNYVKSTDSLPVANDNQWHHVIIVFDAKNNTNVGARIYFDGKNYGYIDSTVAKSGWASTTSYKLNTGRSASGGENFTGFIDEVKIYNGALTDEEIKIDYNRGSAIQMGTLSSGTGNTAPSTASSQEYCVPGDTTFCSPPISRLDFNEKSGSTAYDSSGIGNTGLFTTQPRWGPGKYGGAAVFTGFTGTNNYLDVTSLDNTNFPQTYGTVEFWIKSDFTKQGLVGGDGGYFDTYQSSKNHIFIRATVVGTNSVQVFAQDDTTAYIAGTVLTNVLQDNQWNHLAVTYDTTTDNFKIYTNGINRYNGTMTNTSWVPNGQDVRLGTYIDGSVDQFQVYNYVRTPAQIAWDYNRGKPVAWYDFDECQGAVAYDRAADPATGGTREDGTITIGGSGTQTVLGTCTVGVGSTSAWGNGSVGKYNASLSLDGTDDYVNVGVGVGSSANSVSMWVKPTSNSVSIMQTAAGVGLSVNSGIISATGFTSPTIYINGVTSSTLTAGVWQMVTVTTSTNIPATAIKLGLFGSSYFSGQMDEVKIWNYPLTAVQVKTEYNQGAVRFGPASGNP